MRPGHSRGGRGGRSRTVAGVAAASLSGVRLKLTHAIHHLDDLEDRLAGIVETATASIECHRDATGTVLSFRMTDVPDIPSDAAAIAGDAIHNIRSALDHGLATRPS